MRSHVAFVASMLGTLIASAPLLARAESRTSSLSWVRLPGADSCVATQDLARDVEERLGRSVFVSASEADVSVEGHVEPDAGGKGFHAVVSLRDAKGALLGTRELARKEPSCAEMRAPLALIIAVMIDPDAALHPKPPPVAAPQPPPQKPQEPVVVVKKETVYVEVPTLPPMPRPPPAPWYGEVDVTFTGSLGLLPSASAGVSLTGLIEPPHFRPLDLHGSYFFGSDAAADRGARGTFSLAEGGLGGCPLRIRGERLVVYSCLSFDAGALRVHASGFDTSAQDQSRLFLAMELEVRAAFRIAGPLVLSGAVSGLVPLQRDTFVFDRGDGTKSQLFMQSVVGGTASAGLGASF